MITVTERLCLRTQSHLRGLMAPALGLYTCINYHYGGTSQMFLKLGINHRGSISKKVYINADPVLTLAYFKTKLNLVSCISWGR